MQRTTFDERKARVLSAHVAARRKQARSPARRTLAVAGALVALLVCFFVLKGVTLAWQGEDVFTSAAVAEPTSLRHWLTGIDPLTRLIAGLFAPLQP